MSEQSGYTLHLIEELIRLRFPGLDIADQVLSEDPDILAELQNDVGAYRAELSGLSEYDLEATAWTAKSTAKLAEEQFLSSQEELARFFNLPGAKADYRPWGLVASWTLDQATALFLGKEPTVVTWERVKEFVDVSNFARRYGQLRAVLEAEPLTFPISPPEFVAWANRRGFSLPDDVIAAVQLPKEEPVQPTRPTLEVAQTIKAGRPASRRGPVEEIILELYGDDIPQLATQELRSEIARKLKGKGLPDPDANTVRRALKMLRVAKGDRNSRN